jgi:type II secretory pathway pseudopilin PulG
MVVIAIIGIATVLAVPNLSSWLVNARIREATGHMEQDMQWARSYALKTDQPVYVQTGYFNEAKGGTACWWTASLSAGGTPILNNAPNMENPNITTPGVTSPVLFQTRYPDVSCQYVELNNAGLPMIPPPALGATYNLEFSPNGTILASTNGQPYSLTYGAMLLSARTNHANYAQWLVAYYGAGELRSCATQTGPAAAPPYSCAIS